MEASSVGIADFVAIVPNTRPAERRRLQKISFWR
jgi:hypothetical protein